ncbi:MAG: hypothetical protein WD669_04640 [Pirellulales bacterium]
MDSRKLLPLPNRRGHSLMELVAAMVASAMLLAGLGSVMFIARQIAFTPAASAHRINAASLVNELTADLRCATLIIEQSPYVLDFVVADRNADGVAERIRYQWSGTPGAPLTRSLAGGTPVTILDSVEEFLITPTTQAKTTTLKTTVTSAETLLAGNTNVQSGTDREISMNNCEAQQINPAVFLTAAPANATGWNATRADFYGRERDDTTLLVQLRRSGDPNNGPTSNILGQVNIPGTSLTDNFGWNTATFASPVSGLALHRRFNLVFTGVSSDKAVRLQLTDTAAGGVLESSDTAATWQYMPSRQMYYRLYGTYTTPGSSYDVTRTYVRQVRVVLRAGSQSAARIDASIPLDNTPELFSNYWRLDFDANPTSVDADGSGAVDWATTGGGAFATGNLAGGVWTASGAIETRPLNDFIKVTTVEVGCRNTTVGGNGAVVRINADRQSGLHAPLFTYLQRQSDGTQTLTLYGKSSDSANVQLFKIQRLPSDFVRIRLTIDPANNIVNLQLNGEDQGTFTYPTYAPSTTDRFLTMFADTSAAQFDYAEVRVAAP